MPFPLPAQLEPPAQLNFDALALALGGGVTGQLLTPDANGNAKWGPRILYGLVGSAGTIVNPGAGGWSVSRSAVGRYTITFTTAFVTSVVLVATPDFAAGNVALDVSQSVSAPTVQITNFVPAFVDANFSFIVIGV